MSMSGGGGYCDCGDPEAWKAEPFCDTHIKGCCDAKTGTPESKLPQDLQQRVEIVMRTVLKYCYEMLTWETSMRVPNDLENKAEDGPAETFATMLFNDEIHTYEQVISTLSRAIDCTQKEAIDYATTIDREGRSIVKVAQFNSCANIKTIIERITSRHGSKPLKVEVMLAAVIAHQTYAMRLLGWLQSLLNHCEGFRSIFSRIMMEPQNRRNESPDSKSTISEPSLLEDVMRADISLWKTARNQWHQLFITGLLMNNESKKTFAKVITRIYSTLMRDFVTDDHEHSVSITSLTVQLYTVPSLAHSLIAEDSALQILLKTFNDECRKYQNNDHKLQFERNHNSMMVFRRAQYILLDLKYLLTTKPTEWTERLRSNFMHAFTHIIELLDWMQGMDPVTRQVGQHVEFEAEWETGINMQLKLSPVISLIIEWCGSNWDTLRQTLRHSLKELSGKGQVKMQAASRTIGGTTVNNCVDYEVSSLPISIHIPLSRMVSGLLLHLGQLKENVTYDSPELYFTKRPTLVELMEYPLRTLVMIAQFRAGMWRRNGYSLVNQVYFYHNVRLREEMYDRDIQMLQYVAAHLDPNEFLVHLINKFGLYLVWSQENYDGYNRKPEEDYLRQTITLVEEFLSLLLIIVSERFTPGIGQVTFEERIKKEIVQWLCVEPMTHSDLLKVLPKEASSSVVVESLINLVAEFKRPSQQQAGGKYEVKQDWLQWFNPFFYHYTRQDQSAAEEAQLKKKKLLNEAYVCCPPPVPPELTPQYSKMKDVLKSDVMLHIIQLVLKRTLSAYSASFSETQFEKMLHLVGIALHEEERYLSSPEAGPDVEDFDFTQRSSDKGIFRLLEDCLSCPKIETHSQLLKWTLDKFRTVSGRRGKPLCEVQSTSGLASNSQKVDYSDYDKKKRAEMAAKRRARIMAQMNTMQQNFIKEHTQYLENMATEDGSPLMKEDIMDTENHPVAVGLSQRGRDIQSENETCILCREQQDVTTSGRCLVLSAFVQRSTVLSKNRDRKVNSGLGDDAPEPHFMPADLYFGPHVSTCGHVMHSDCWQKFFESVLAKERRRPLRYGRHVSFDVDKNEFLCPLCECLSNTVIPILPALQPGSQPPQTDISMHDWLMGLKGTVEKSQTDFIKDPSMNGKSRFTYPGGRLSVFSQLKQAKSSSNVSSPALCLN